MKRTLDAARKEPAKQKRMTDFFPGSKAASSGSGTETKIIASTEVATSRKDAVRLHNGVAMPVLGFGTYALGKKAEASVKVALETGYRLIDTGQIYERGSTERAVGSALQKSGLNRSEVFISTKVWRTHHGFEKTIAACTQSLKRLELEYIDLYMIHWPGPQPSSSTDWTPETRAETWKALEKLLKDGKVRAIGVCNYSIRHLKELLKTCEIKPMVNQVEVHPWLIQKELQTFCRDEGIAVQAFASLGSSDSKRAHEFFALPAIKAPAIRCGTSPAAVLLRWSVQKGCHIIPKSSDPERIRKNAECLGISLTPQEMLDIDSLEKGVRLTWGGQDPDSIE